MQCDLFKAINSPGGWDLLIAHPPCTYLCSSGLHWTVRGLRDPKLTENALDFVRKIMTAPVAAIAIENPVGCISTRIQQATQYIQPYEFGEDASKKTGLWLQCLPPLIPTKYIEPRYVCCGAVLDYNVGFHGCPSCCGDERPLPRWANQTNSGQNRVGPGKKRWAKRSATYPGIAAAMADQWG
jgi:hypothetical protein